MLCSICKDNYAVIFVTKIINGKQTQEGLCLSCAKKSGIQPINQMIEQSGMTDEDLENMNRQVKSLFENMGIDDSGIFPVSDDPDNFNGTPNPFKNFINNIFMRGGSDTDDNLNDLPSLGSNTEDIDGNVNGINDDRDDSDNQFYPEPGSHDKQSGPITGPHYLNDGRDLTRGRKNSEGNDPGNKGVARNSGNTRNSGGARNSGDPRNSGDTRDFGEPRDSKDNTKTKVQDKKNIKKKKYLDMFGINLTDQAREDRIDRVIGREKEIDRVIQILNRRMKNNPVLIGEPGVGKTAIAEGLAVRIAKQQVPAKLFGMEVYQLDLTSVVAGTHFRGQFESRMKGIIEEAKVLGNIILVIDELHSIMGAGEAEGALNAANILKPALQRGEIQVIGATTLNEYRKHIEKDAAFERRFQPVLVDEPSIEDSIEILKGIKDYYENYHRVILSDEVIKAAVILSERYINDRFLPDKAIDIIDEAGSRANLKNLGLVELAALKEELRRVQEEKESAISADYMEDYQKAADLKVRECKILTDIKKFEDRSCDIVITEEDVAYVVESWTKIPVQKITEVEAAKLLNLEERLHRRIVGQNEAVSSVSRAIRRNRSGFRKRRKPSSFIFVGPTGVGKTELVKALAEELFGSEEAMIRLDMSEFMEKHTVSKLIGSPPGYVGYDEAGQLTEKIRRKPYSVILMDEIEKAHPDVFNMLLQILDDGRLTDSHGKTVNFENTVIIMTSNAGTTLKANGIGFNNEGYHALESRVRDAMKELFRPEFLNRVDEIIIFTELSKDDQRRIIDLMLLEVENEAHSKGMEISVSDAAKEFIMEKGYDPKYGARPLRRTIQRLIEDEISELFLKGALSAGTRINVDFKVNEDGCGKLSFEQETIC